MNLRKLDLLRLFTPLPASNLVLEGLIELANHFKHLFILNFLGFYPCFFNRVPFFGLLFLLTPLKLIR